jgi:hypothetical protein
VGAIDARRLRRRRRGDSERRAREQLDGRVGRHDARSPEWNEASDPATRAKAQTDFVGIAIHCARGGGVCTGSPNAKPDPLPDEPGGYDGFQALYGAKYVNPAINHGNGCVENTEDQAIADPAGNCGFPGFDAMLAKNTLGEVAQMQEAGVPVTFG